MNPSERRVALRGWLDAGITAVDPEERTTEALKSAKDGPPVVIAIGKAAAAMSRGAANALGPVSGVCVTDVPGQVPSGVELLIGDHPVPSEASFEAGKRVLEIARSAKGRCIALISGGGSALCEQPLPGIDRAYLQMVHSLLLDRGASIEETNLVRRHLSSIKCGGVARAADVPMETYVISDVGEAGPGVVASGPTIPIRPEPDRAAELMGQFDISIPESVWEAMNRIRHDMPGAASPLVLADGRVAAEAIAEAARTDGVESRVLDGWIAGPLEASLDDFFAGSGPGLSVACGEPTLNVRGDGIGGRNSHAALMAATRIMNEQTLFVSFATDGVDGRSDAAGAIVDGVTLDRGGDPGDSLLRFDSASYLDRTRDLIRTGPTGTNVADLWALWRT
jgi:hydroxypyruvate reductase